MQYRRAVFCSPLWTAIRESTGERIAFDGTFDGWAYTYPLHSVCEVFTYLQDLADWAWDSCDAKDWIPYMGTQEKLTANSAYGKFASLDG